LITFILLHLLPGSLARDILGTRATPPAIAQFNQQNGLNHSVWIQYFDYLGKLIHGNFGYSFRLDRSVGSLITNELPRDLVLGGLSLIFSLLIAIPIGVAQAVKRNTVVDHGGTAISFILYSMPGYAICILLIQFFSISLHIFPAEVTANGSWVNLLTHPNQLVLPVASLTLVSYAYFSRYMRSSAIDTLAQDFIRTARAKGLPERLVLLRHLLRNSLLTVVTLIGVSIPVIITGTLLVEYIFNYPGLGLEYYNAAVSNDYEVMIGLTVLIGAITVLGNLVADIGYAVLDPRIRY